MHHRLHARQAEQGEKHAHTYSYLHTPSHIRTYYRKRKGGKRLADRLDSPFVVVPDGIYRQVLLVFQLRNRYSRTHATRLLAARTLSVRMELALACRNTMVTRIRGVALNVSSVRTVRETGRASETSAPTLARGRVARGPRATL
jgi:hypothetical protein